MSITRAGRSWPHGTEATIACGTAALVCAIYLSFAGFGFDVLEEGYFLTNARRVLDGDLPYRDFDAPYSPGVFYLYAWLMDWLGPNVVALRGVQILARLSLMLVLYAVGRAVCRPFYAALAPALIIALDTVPGIWSLHPGWLTTPCAIAAAGLIALYLRDGQLRWLVISGVASGVAFAFKQNLAAYGLMAALWFLAVFEARLPRLRTGARRPVGTAGECLTLARRATQAAALVLLPAVPALIALPYMSPLVVALFLLPLAVLSYAGTHAMRASAAPARDAGLGVSEVGFFARLGALLLGFGAVTLAWFVPFLVALDGRADLMGALIGRIDQTGYFLGMTPPDFGHFRVVAVAMLPALLVPLLCAWGLWGRRGLAVLLAAATALTLAATATSWNGAGPWNAADGAARLVAGSWRALQVEGAGPYSGGELILYLPTMAFWAALPLAIAPLRRRRTEDGAVGPSALTTFWYLAVGATLLFNQYPRMDAIHLLWSGGVLFLVGAAALDRWERQAQKAVPALAAAGAAPALRLALALLPAVAALPTVETRIAHARPFLDSASGLSSSGAAGPRLERLDAPGDQSDLWLLPQEAQAIQEVLRALQAETRPDEPIFTYPAIPGFYYLAARRNPTPLSHVFPGMATPAQEQEMLRQLERVNFIIWDDAGARLWVRPDAYAPLNEYARRYFALERTVGPYAVLSRRAAAAAAASGSGQVVTAQIG